MERAQQLILEMQEQDRQREIQSNGGSASSSRR
jgi:hypothetical protein